MASINNGFNVSQQNYQMTLQNQVRDSGKNAAQQTVSQGNTGVTKQQSDTGKGVKEQSNLSEAARKALEADDLKNAQAKGGAENAGKAAGKKKAKEREQTKEGGGDVRGAERQHYAAGDMQKMPDGSTIVHGDEDTPSFEISATGSKRLAQMDDKSFTQATVVDTMPGHAKAVAGKMVEEKTDTGKKREKFADLKMGDPKFSDQVEGVILEPTANVDPRGKVGKADIRGPKHEKPHFAEDPHLESTQMETARQQQRTGAGGNEAFVA